ncbi:MAG: DUF2099 family protein [Methanobrevibacter sp.]|jgi:putative methanogenesis marker protein 8|nr:DUF2099 family protein [Methanobrevibacter sp.]
MNADDEHIIEAIGKAKVTIKNGKVKEVTEPEIQYCPLFHKHRGIERIDKDIIKENMEFRINDFGMCSKDRIIEMKDFLSFGISETLSTLLEESIIDCAVMVCEGCGTVFVTEKEKAQGIGGRVSALIKTSPIPEIIAKIKEENILNPKTAEIDQIAGTKLAIKKGYKKIAVTIAKSDDAKKLRELEEENKDKGIAIYIFAVHTTGINLNEAKELFKYSDVITSCASKYIRDIGEKKAKLKVGESIPIYASTEKGKKFLEKRIAKIGGISPKKDPKQPNPLI